MRIVSLKLQGRRYAPLRALLTALDPDVIHLHADAESARASQVSRWCAWRARRGFVLELASWRAPDIRPRGRHWLQGWRARRTLSRADAILAPSSEALGAARRLGFTGSGIVTGPGQEAASPLRRAEARAGLQLPIEGAPVFGWVGPVMSASDVIDVLEAVALCEAELMLVIAVDGRTRSDIIDSADALEILHRVRFVAPEPGRGRAADGELASFPAMLGAIDALIVTPTRRMIDRSCLGRSVALAQTHGVPVVYADLPGFGALVGPGGWPVRAADPGLLAQLLGAIVSNPARLRATGEAAAAHAAQRYSPQAAAAELAQAIHAAHLGRRELRMLQPEPAAAPSAIGLAGPGADRL